jgi:hypothetical protein
MANPFHALNFLGSKPRLFFDKTVGNDYPTIPMEIAGHPDLEVLKFKEVFTFNFLELLPVGDFAFICQVFYDSQNFFSIDFREAIQKFLGRAPAASRDR